VGRREEKKIEKRQNLESAALRLFLDNGFERTSIEQIAAECEIARGTFYLYFPDKLSLFEVLHRRWHAPVLEAMDAVHAELQHAQSPEECRGIYQRMAMQLAMIGLENKQEILLAFRESRSSSEAGVRLRTAELDIQNRTLALTQHASERGLIDAPSPNLASLIILGAIERLYYEVLVGTDLGNPQQVAASATQLLSRVLGL